MTRVWYPPLEFIDWIECGAQILDGEILDGEILDDKILANESERDHLADLVANWTVTVETLRTVCNSSKLQLNLMLR